MEYIDGKIQQVPGYRIKIQSDLPNPPLGNLYIRESGQKWPGTDLLLLKPIWSVYNPAIF